MTTNKPLVLIDADIYLHQASSHNETVIDWDGPEEVVSIYSDLADCITSYDHYTAPFQDLGEVYHCLSMPPNWRYEVLPSYKGNRTKRKPVGYGALKKWVLDNRPTKYVEGLEADDLLGILGTRDHSGRKVIIVSEDKDLLTIPGTVIRGGKRHEIDERTADINWLTQTLTGDVTDGYKGCPGVGAVKAAKLLSFVETTGEPWLTQAWRHVVAAYEAAGLTAADALQQARVARILRNSDYDPINRKPLLWNPPKV